MRELLRFPCKICILSVVIEKERALRTMQRFSLPRELSEIILRPKEHADVRRQQSRRASYGMRELWGIETLNATQQEAFMGIVSSDQPLMILQGPPGTG
jgi:predicted ribonuclease YlaK